MAARDPFDQEALGLSNDKEKTKQPLNVSQAAAEQYQSYLAAANVTPQEISADEKLRIQLQQLRIARAMTGGVPPEGHITTSAPVLFSSATAAQNAVRMSAAAAAGFGTHAAVAADDSFNAGGGSSFERELWDCYQAELQRRGDTSGPHPGPGGRGQ